MVLTMFTELYNHYHSQFQNIFIIPPNENLSPLAVTPHFLTALGKHWSTFCLYRPAYSGLFIQMESYNLWSFLTGFYIFI